MARVDPLLSADFVESQNSFLAVRSTFIAAILLLQYIIRTRSVHIVGFLFRTVQNEKQFPTTRNLAVSLRPPCDLVIHEAEAYNTQHGHELRGALSRKAGFLPLFQPDGKLPAQYLHWEEVAGNLDALIHNQKLRLVLDAMPLLHADDEKVLPDRYLQRAATILGLVAHSYVRMHIETQDRTADRQFVTIPPSLQVPWREVCRRMGRDDSFLTYVDLVVANFRSTGTGSAEDMTVENIQHLIAPKNTQQDHVFYGTMFEIAALTTPILNDVVSAQRAVLEGDVQSLTLALHRIRSVVEHVRKVSLPKISPNSKSATYVDPIVWVKSVADLAVPWKTGRPGASGTAHSFFHLMDVFIGRIPYKGRMGKEAKATRLDHPVHWQNLYLAVEKISVADYVKSSNNCELQQIWQELNNLYTGHDGILGFHRRKIFGYLFMAFRIGRSSTINGFAGKATESPWNKVAAALEVSRQERRIRLSNGDDEPRLTNITHSPDRSYPVSELLRHTNKASGFWLAAEGRIFDVTSYMKHHPGGHKIVQNCCGRDVTGDLKAVAHLSDPRIKSRVDKLAIGTLQVKELASPALQRLYDMCVALGYQTADLAKTFENHMTLLDAKLTSLDTPGELSTFKLNLYLDAEEHLRGEVVTAAALHVLPVLEALRNISQGELAQWISELSRSLDSIRAATKTGPGPVTAPSLSKLYTLAKQNEERLSHMQDCTVRLLESLESIPEQTVTLDQQSMDNCADAVERFLGEMSLLGRLR